MKPLPRSALPKRIQVGGAVYKIEVKALRNCVGETYSRSRVIRLDPSALTSPEYAVNTLLHEVMHAIWYEWGIKDSEMEDFAFQKGYATEERAVNGLCNGLCAVFANNPALFRLVSRYRGRLKGD